MKQRSKVTLSSLYILKGLVNYWACEESPTSLGCSIEISRDIYNAPVNCMPHYPTYGIGWEIVGD